MEIEWSSLTTAWVINKADQNLRWVIYYDIALEGTIIFQFVDARLTPILIDIQSFAGVPHGLREHNDWKEKQPIRFPGLWIRNRCQRCERNLRTKKQNQCSYSVLSIDVEGLDGLVLKNAHLPDCIFDIVILETSNDMRMKRLGYKLLTNDHYNKIYVKKQIDI